MLKTDSHQSYDPLAVRFTAGIRPCGSCRQNCIPQVDFSLNVRQPYDARTIDLRSRAVLSSDVLAKLQDCCKFACRRLCYLTDSNVLLNVKKC